MLGADPGDEEENGNLRSGELPLEFESGGKDCFGNDATELKDPSLFSEEGPS